MNTSEIAKLDIKLLIAFVTILEKGSVSKAAEELNMTQPALSKNLQRLREIFHDQLFIRQAYGLMPTARANELAELIYPIIRSLQELILPSQLDLSKLDRRFRLMIDEGDLEIFIEPLLAYLQQEAPEVQMSINAWNDSYLEPIIDGKVDLGIMHIKHTPSSVRSKLVGYMETCIIISDGHPLYKVDQPTFDDLIQHRVVTHHMKPYKGHSYESIEPKLRQQGYNVKTHLETDSLMAALRAVKQGMALVTTRSVGELCLNLMNSNKHFHPIRLLPIPEKILDLDEFKGRHPIHIFWHEHFHNDLAHRWLREKIIELMRNSPWMHRE